MAANVKTSFFHLCVLLVLIINSFEVQGNIKVGFYKESCPLAETITSNVVKKTLSVAPSLSGPLLRMFYHDCFVRVRHYILLLIIELRIIFGLVFCYKYLVTLF